jgi:hypothetical protein
VRNLDLVAAALDEVAFPTADRLIPTRRGSRKRQNKEDPMAANSADRPKAFRVRTHRRESTLQPEMTKTIGYLISCCSVALLGVSAYPGAEKAGLLPALFAGMAASVAGMALRWLSYEIEKGRKKP